MKESTGLKHTTVTLDDINQLLTAINGGDSIRLKNTEPLTQDEINQLLTASDDDNT
jgi:hypothetical protein